MKKIKNKIVATMLVFLFLLTGFAALGLGRNNTAMALSKNYAGEAQTYYYFFDYYPSTGYTELIEMSPEFEEEGVNIVYDRRIIDEDTFYRMINDGYFNGFGENSVVTIDIKTFIPDEYHLEQLFSGIKSQYSGIDEIKTAFITIAENNYYNGAEFTNYLDDLTYTDYNKLQKFVNNAVTTVKKNINENLQDVCILIDGNTFLGKSEKTIDNEYPFLDFLKTRIESEALGFSDLHLFVNTYGNDFINPDGNSSGNYPTADLLLDKINSTLGPNSPSVKDIAVLGFHSLTGDFNNFVNAAWKEGKNILPILLECDPYVYDPNGIPIILFGTGKDGVDDGNMATYDDLLLEWLANLD